MSYPPSAAPGISAANVYAGQPGVWQGHAGPYGGMTQQPSSMDRIIMSQGPGVLSRGIT